MSDLKKDLKHFAMGEFFFVVFAMLAGALQFWSLFAALSLVCILLPLWLTAAAACIVAFPELKELFGETDE